LAHHENDEQKNTNTHGRLRLVLLGKAAIGVLVASAIAGGFWLRAQGLTFGEFREEMSRKETEPRFDWKSVDKKHWQAQAKNGTPSSSGEEPRDVTDAKEGNGAGCPSGMARVKGNFRAESHGQSTGEIERLQDTACTDWISRDFPARCRTFDRDKIAQEVQKIPTKALDFCIDRFEYPNIRGANPMIVVTFHEADALCKKDQKRLCNENEWTFACEGEEVRPYPYGYTRDSTACVMDRNWRPFKEGALQPRDGKGAQEELDRLWQAEPSGSRGGCKSTFGVYDMTGNVDEWTRTVNSTGYQSILKGGYWGPVRARCRPSTRAHGEDFVAYQQSFRCCADSNASVAAPVPPVAQTTADAGAPSTTNEADAGSSVKATADITPTWHGSQGQDDDELKALRKKRVSVGCAHADVGDAPLGGVPSSAIAIGAVALAAATRRRLRAR
jgi:formylglycine-generating enzyme